MQSETGDKSTALPRTAVATQPIVRWSLFVFGILLVALGLIGIVVPGLPTTVFLIAAAWVFSRSSPKFQQWLWFHPRLGPSLRNWYHYKIIPLRAKVMAVAMMAVSLVVMAYVSDNYMTPFIVMAAILILSAVYVCTRPSHCPDSTGADENVAPEVARPNKEES